MNNYIYHERGDLLKSDCNVIAHQANCYSTFGAGIALQIKKLYPEAFKADSGWKVRPELKLSHFTSAKAKNGVVVYNLYGQLHYGSGVQQTNYAALEHAMNEMLIHLASIGYDRGTKIGLPFGIGCGLAGGDWNIVFYIIKQVFSNHERDVFLYQLD